MAEHIVAVFETEPAAQAAAESLRSAGIPSTAIRQYKDHVGGQPEVPAEQTSTHTSSGGFWSWLFGEDSTTETRSAYSHDLYERRASTGNIIVSVTVDEDAKIHQAIAALEAHHPIDIDEHDVDEAASTTAPVTGASTTGRDFSSADVARAGGSPTGPRGGRVSSTESPPLSTSSIAASGTPGSTSPATAGGAGQGFVSANADAPRPAGLPEGEQVIPLAEEQLDVGKRMVDRGTTRIRRYVVEKPVEENVTLRDERVTVERRKPIETTAAPGTGAFEERVVEVRETAEEPVVAKTAHVAEEVVVGREATERTETVKDTVRREDVEVSKDAGMKP